MKQQTLTFRKGESLVIHTPLGMITISQCKDKRKLTFELPESMSVSQNLERALKDSPFWVLNGEGKPKPLFTRLFSMFDSSGKLVTKEQPTITSFDLVE